MRTRVFAVFIFIIFPLSVYADTINVNCPNNVKSGEEINCEVIGNTTTGITDLEFNVNLSDNLSYVTFNTYAGWNGDAIDGHISLYGDKLVKDAFKIGVLRIKNTGIDLGKIAISDVVFYNDNDNRSVSSTVKEINITTENENSEENNLDGDNYNLSNDDGLLEDCYLVDLTIDNYELDFHSDIHEYKLEIGDETRLSLFPKFSSDDVTYEITGNKDLTDGSIIAIDIYKEDVRQAGYIINIKKKNAPPKRDYTNIFIIVIACLVAFNLIRFVLGLIRKKRR